MTETIRLSHRYAVELGEHFSTPTPPTGLPDPELLDVHPGIAQMLDIPIEYCQQAEFLDWISGNLNASSEQPIASVYAGHQFGQFVPQLGDGRALILGDIKPKHTRYELQLKGAGKTPYSRFADGRSISRSVIREHLASAAMHGLGIPTTTSLAICRGSEPVFREELADQASMLLRVAETHVRFGTFEYFHFRGETDQIRQLCEYLIEHHLHDLENTGNPCEAILQQAVESTARLIAQWQAIGFVHGVMNTDNMSILGHTLDYGPFGFIETYNPQQVFNQSDTKGRYAFDQQPLIGLWNCNVLARAFSNHLPVTTIQSLLMRYEPIYLETLEALQRQKLGLLNSSEPQADSKLFEDLLALMETSEADYTTVFRQLSFFEVSDPSPSIRDTFHGAPSFDDWLDCYRQRLELESRSEQERMQQMQSTNPKYILRQQMAEHAINQAQHENDFSEIQRLRKLLQHPYQEQPEYERYAHPVEGEATRPVSCLS